jgi:hypothetical protein
MYLPVQRQQHSPLFFGTGFVQFAGRSLSLPHNPNVHYFLKKKKAQEKAHFGWGKRKGTASTAGTILVVANTQHYFLVLDMPCSSKNRNNQNNSLEANETCVRQYR